MGAAAPLAARGKKLGQRRLTFTADRDTYELGQQVRLRLAVLDPILRQQLPSELSVQVNDEKDQPVKMEKLQKQPGEGDYLGSFPADRVGRFVFRLPAVANAGQNLDANIEVIEPRLELADPRVNPISLSSLASETLGQSVPFDKARVDPAEPDSQCRPDDADALRHAIMERAADDAAVYVADHGRMGAAESVWDAINGVCYSGL